ncbi:MAG: oligosaccharide flippase family protein [Gallionella sp.]|nr:oligosaccharide flippase family protein [Gallionella sp.]
MSFKRNVLVSYVSQIYVTLIGIVMLPMYLTYMGAEAYGLVGFFAMLQAWFNLLDMGLTPTMVRETSRFNAGGSSALSYRGLVRTLEGIFVVIALAGGGGLFGFSGYIATSWLKVAHLPLVEVETSIELMAATVSLRWVCGLYRSIISGSERLVWIGVFNASIASLRFVGVLPVLIYVGSTPIVFFSYQLLLGVVEVLGVYLYSKQLLPKIPNGVRAYISFASIKPTLKFSLTIAFTASVWVLVTQTDKLILSKLLPLAEYGYFTIAVLVASGVMMVSGPVSSAAMPRMANLDAAGDHEGLIRIYRQSTQLVAVVAGSVSVTLAMYAEHLLLIWTSNVQLAQHAAPILALYSIGNGILAVSGFAYYLQFAKGNLRLHWIGSMGFLILFIPAIAWSANHYGGVGAGYVWVILNLIYLIAWVPLVHHRVAPSLHKLWFFNDVILVWSSIAFAGSVLYYTMPRSQSRFGLLAEILLVGIGLLFAGAISASFFKSYFKSKFNKVVR